MENPGFEKSKDDPPLYEETSFCGNGLIMESGEPCGRLWPVLLGTTPWTGCQTWTFIVMRRASADTEPSDLPYRSCTMFSRRSVTMFSQIHDRMYLHHSVHYEATRPFHAPPHTSYFNTINQTHELILG